MLVDLDEYLELFLQEICLRIYECRNIVVENIVIMVTAIIRMIAGK